MKQIIFVLLAIVMLFGCNGNINFGAPKIPPELCSEFDASTSLLLKVSEEREIPLNEVYYGLLDLTAIGLITEALEKEKVAEFMAGVGDWYVKHYPVSYTSVIQYMTDEAKAQALSGILNRRIGAYESSLIISKYDDCLLKAGWSNAMDELFLR